MADLMPSLSSDDEAAPSIKGKNKAEYDEEESDEEIDQSFEFGGIMGEDGGLASFQETTGWSYQTALDQVQQSDKSAPRLDVGDLISAKRRKVGNLRKLEKKINHGNEQESNSTSDEDSDEDEEEEIELDDADTKKHLGEDVLKTRTGEEEKQGGDDEKNDSDTENCDDTDEREEVAKAKAYFDNAPLQESEAIQVFAQLALSRPLLRGIAAMGFVKPTPIQAAVIPLALQGRDICASAVTGSGKTAAFLLPILERLLHRYLGRTKAIILTPTRELAAQCVGMMTTLSKFTKIRPCLIVGGSKNVLAQAAELKAQPEVVVATPGRLLDHVTNSAGVSFSDVEFLVLDEADRLLDLGFQEEVHELIRACPVQRQTLLFSATMNTKVDDLVKLSLKKPVRVRITDKTDDNAVEVAPRLEQEFIRIRPANEGVNREAILLALLTRTFTAQVIVFFDLKSLAHRMMILCGLNGIRCTELHGNLTQQQRLEALEKFRTGEVDVLLATDLAARGLDIDRVACVISFEMPSQIETYIHRIGRTARAGRGGCSCTLVGEGRRHLMKDLIKDAESKISKLAMKKDGSKDAKSDRSFESGVIRSRTIPPAVVAHFAAKIQSMEQHVDEILQAEAVAKMDRLAEIEAVRAQNIIEHSSEIHSRPKKEWFASNKQKEQSKLAAAEKQKAIEAKVGTGMHRMTRKKRRARESMEALDPGPRGNDDDQGNDGVVRGKRLDIKLSARAQKRKKEQIQQAKYGLSVDEMLEASRLEKKRKTKGRDAIGDASLFDEEHVMHSRKRANTEEKPATAATSSYHFRGFDPDKKMGKRKGHKAFKSRSKYKRR